MLGMEPRTDRNECLIIEISKHNSDLHFCPLWLPEFLQAPEVSGVILQILHLHPHHGPGWWPVVVIVRVLDGQQVRRKGRVERVGHQDKLERHFLLQLNGDGVCLLQGEIVRLRTNSWYGLDYLEKDSIAPEIISERCELVNSPLQECPGCQLILSLRPSTFCFKYWVY